MANHNTLSKQFHILLITLPIFLVIFEIFILSPFGFRTEGVSNPSYWVTVSSGIFDAPNGTYVGKLFDVHQKEIALNHIIFSNLSLIDISKHYFCTNILKGEIFRKFTSHTYIIRSSWEKYEGIYMHLIDIYFSTGGYYGTLADNMLQLYKLAPSNNKDFSFSLKMKFDSVIYIHYEHNVYGHYIWDFLTPLFRFPEHIIKNSNILIFQFENIGTVLLEKVFDIPREKCVILLETHPNDLFYSRELFTVKSKNTLYANMAAIVDFANIIKKRFPPPMESHRHCLHNRKAGTKRSIPNFQNVTESIKKTFPQFNWEILPIDYHSLIDALKDFQVIKFLFCPAGSCILNCIFMQPKSVVVEAMTTQFCQNDAFLSSFFNYFCIAFPWSDKLFHHGGDFANTPINISEVLYYINIGLEVAQNQKFPPEFPKNTKRMCW